jgi:hypothetical protein
MTMRILVDADGCPVVDAAIAAAKKYGAPCILFCDNAHVFERDGAQTVTVDKGADSADFALTNRIQPGDIVITQDYGLAAMALARKATVMNQNGMLYNESNIEMLLQSRYAAGKIRRAGGRIKGPRKRSREEDLSFGNALDKELTKEDKLE